MKYLAEENNGKYYLPVKFRSKIPLLYHFGYISLIVIFSVPIFLMSKEEWGNDIIFVKILALIFNILLMYCWLFTGVLKLGRVELDRKLIYIRTPFKKRTFLLRDIHDMYIINAKYNINQLKINNVIITEPMFKGIDFNVLIRTINETLKEQAIYDNLTVDKDSAEQFLFNDF